MAAGEYISVSSPARRRGGRPRDRGRGARASTARAELHELAKIYEDRGVEPGLARLVAEQLMAHDELGAHVRDELGITELATGAPGAGRVDLGRRVHRAARSGRCSRCSHHVRSERGAIAVVTLVALAVLGAVGAALGGAPRGRGALRTLVLSSTALVLSYAVGNGDRRRGVVNVNRCGAAPRGSAPSSARTRSPGA